MIYLAQPSIRPNDDWSDLTIALTDGLAGHGIPLYCPLRAWNISDSLIDKSFHGRLWRANLSVLRQCNGLVADLTAPSIGVARELEAARLIDKPVWGLIKLSSPHHPVSLHDVMLFGTPEEVIGAVTESLGLS